MENIEDYYIDQAPTSVDFADRNISSAYTPYGIKQIESNFVYRIWGLSKKVRKVYEIVRKPARYCNIATREEGDLSYYDYYEPVKPEETNKYMIMRVIWDNGLVRDFINGNNSPKFRKNGTENPNVLRKEIMNNVHLHQKIKDNLISNLNERLKVNENI